MKMRKIIATIALMSAIVSSTVLTGCGSGSNEKDYSGFYKTFSVGLDNYTVEATCETDDGRIYGVKSVVFGDSAMSVVTTGKKNNGFITTEAIVSEDFSMVQMTSNNDHESFYCKNNMFEDIQENMITGRKLYQIIQNAIESSIYSEYSTSTTIGDVVRVIYKTDTEASIGESHFNVYLDGDNKPIIVELPCMINGNQYTVKLDLINTEAIEMDKNSSQYTEMLNLQKYYLDLLKFTTNYVFQDNIEDDIPIEEEPIEEEVIEEEPIEEVPIEPEYTEEELVTLSSTKDLFVQLTFSDFVDEVEFISPTGGSYKPSSGNVEIMKDSNQALIAYYRIPNAEVGIWKLRCNSTNNTIDYEVITDNKIKITSVTTSEIKDGIMALNAELSKDKGLDINYQYYVSIDDGFNTCATSNGIVNTQDAAKYNISLMDVASGTYKAHVRIEYMYDGQKYFNMFTTSDFTKE